MYCNAFPGDIHQIYPNCKMWGKEKVPAEIWEGGKWYNAAKIEAVKRLCSFISLTSSQSGQILANENIRDSISSKGEFMFLNPWDMWFGCLNRISGSSGPYHVNPHIRFFLLSNFQILCVHAQHAHYVHKQNHMRSKSRMPNSVRFLFVHLNYTIWTILCICFVNLN